MNHTLRQRIQWTDKVFDRHPKLLEEFLRLSEELAHIEEIEERIAYAAKKAQQKLERQLQNQAELG